MEQFAIPDEIYWSIPLAALVLVWLLSVAWRWTLGRPGMAPGSMLDKHPVLYRELRALLQPKARMRWVIWGAAAAMLLYAAGTSYAGMTGVFRQNPFPVEMLAVNFWELLLSLTVLVLVPVLTATAISREEEKQSLDLLLATPLSARTIIVEKLLAALWFVGLALLCPLGISLLIKAGMPMMRTTALLSPLNWAIFLCCLGAIGLWCSARFRKTATAISFTYGIFLLLLIMTKLSGFILYRLLGMESSHALFWVRIDGWLFLAGECLLAAVALLGASRALTRLRG